MAEQNNTLGERFANRLVSLVERRAGLIVLIGFAVTAVSIWLAMQLRVDQDLKILLPPDAPALERLDALETRMGNLSDLIVEIRSPSREANLRFGEAIQAKLVARPDIRFSLFRQDRTFFETNALLFLSLHDLLDLRQRVIARIKKEVAATFNQGFEDEPDAQAPAVVADKDDFDLSEQELRDRYGVDKQLPEYFEADEGRIIVVKARPRKGTTDVTFTRDLLKGVQADIDALAPPTFHPDMVVAIEGSYQTRQKDVRTVAGDSKRGTLVAFVLLLFCLAIYFRKIRAVPIVMIPLLMSVVVALGYAELRYGYLNLVSAFIFAVLLGLGIDFGIHILGRYESERYRGHDRPAAMRITMASTGMSTMTGAASTIGVYLVLMLADFQGFAQFGELAAVGILAAAVCVLTVVPAFVTLIERWRPWKPARGRVIVDTPPPPRVRPPGRWAAYAALVLALGLGWGVFAAIHVPDIKFEYDFRKLGPIEAEQAEADEKAKLTYKDAIGKENTFGPVVALTKDLKGTEWLHRMLTDAKNLTTDQAEHFALVRSGTYVPPPAPAAAAAPAPEKKPAADDDDEDDEEEDAEEDDPVFAKLAAEAAGEGKLSAESIARFKDYDDARVVVMNRSLVQVLSVFSFVPERQEDKLLIIRDIRRRIDAKRQKLTEDTKKKLADVDKYLVVDATLAVDDLPDWVKVQFRDDQGELGRFVIFRNHGSKDDYLVSKELHETFFDLPSPEGSIPSAGNLYIMPELLDSVAADAPMVIGLAVLVVIFTAFALFRTAAGTGAVTLTIVLAVLWLIGVMEVLDWKANFFNIITIPLLLGMGQDYAVHFYHRYTHDGVGRMRRVLKETGGAVFMTTLTTVIGFSGILFANHRGLLSLAWSSVIGVTFAFIASVAILPAIIILSTWLTQRGKPLDEG